ncbi:conserved hypothetical protein [Thermosulfidibacter takaii ABI70S6]|uniref:PatA-like N-terminal domain-containing protein n=1 Tax=Thermosulfidibacter takaii (strain DSM 17441 / JCM 13301 / NBRC 103674 / ABI70S6) TaxID=1298851 RepID=A0A0S3QVH8_THET7|nr:DUF4388 domain-containing protein [Thermosulfidibacter takaii]BAT72332.1 conserved hypothetical protein [Thermosulfidibacter takaii ABI70S6]
MAIKGDLKHFHPIEILQLIRENKDTGILVVETPKGFIGIYFVEGNVAFAFKSEKMYDLFTQKLIKDFITAIKTKDKALFAKLLSQIKAAVVEFVRSNEGTFSFEKADFFVDDEVKDYLMSTERIIITESKRIIDESVLDRKISSLDMIFQKTKNINEVLNKVQLDADDYKVLDAIDGKRTVKEIIEYTGLPALKVKQILFGFLCAGLIKRAPRKIVLADIFSLKLIQKLINRIRGI